METTFITYAQNFEDLMLWRALKHVQAGFYVDVGAAWPREHSVTAAFYDRGWNGINIEPNPAFYTMLCAERQRDVNLNILIGEKEIEQKDFFVISGTGLSTACSAIAKSHGAGGFCSERVSVEQKTLAEIFSTYCQGRDIHFLKVDVEGSETAVLMSNNWVDFRPWICVVEATLPLSREDSYDDWDKFLLLNDYIHAYSDGLNRFYVRKESASLVQVFGSPPNVFDGYETYETVMLKKRIKQLELKLKSRSAKASAEKLISLWSKFWSACKLLLAKIK